VLAELAGQLLDRLAPATQDGLLQRLGLAAARITVGGARCRR
jgi:hypothetical protein